MELGSVVKDVPVHVSLDVASRDLRKLFAHAKILIAGGTAEIKRVCFRRVRRVVVKFLVVAASFFFFFGCVVGVALGGINIAMTPGNIPGCGGDVFERSVGIIVHIIDTEVVVVVVVFIVLLAGFEYDEESIYFFDNLWMTGSNVGNKDHFVKMRKELFNRWINFAKTGNPRYSSRLDKEWKKYTTWEPFPKGQVGRATNDDEMPSYLYMPAEPGDNLVGQKKSRMIPLDELMTQRTQKKHKKSGLDMCSWVLLEENDNDGKFVDVLLDFNANTAFDYYVTILATMNPTINYVPDQEYIADLPPTLSPTTIVHFVDQALARSSSPPSLLALQSASILGITGIAIATAAATVMLAM